MEVHDIMEKGFQSFLTRAAITAPVKVITRALYSSLSHKMTRPPLSGKGFLVTGEMERGIHRMGDE